LKNEGILHVPAILGKQAGKVPGTGTPFQGFQGGGTFSFHPLGKGEDRVQVDKAQGLSPCLKCLGRFQGIDHRPGVGHTDHGPVTPRRRGKTARFQGFLFGKSGVAKVGVQIDKGWQK
jgi:hypothetical protein